MAYTVNMLVTVEECDRMLDSCNKYKADLLAKQTRLEFMETKYRESTVEVQTGIRLVLADIAFLDSILPTLPEGPKKAEYVYDRNRQEIRLFQLNTKNASSGIFALFENQKELAKVEIRLSETDLLIAALIGRRAELVGGST